MTKEEKEALGQEEDRGRRGGESRRKEGREKKQPARGREGRGVPGSRLCSGPWFAENTPGDLGSDVTSPDFKSSWAPAPGPVGVLRPGAVETQRLFCECMSFPEVSSSFASVFLPKCCFSICG